MPDTEPPRETMPPQATAKPTLRYREFDAGKVAEEVAREAGSLRETLKAYERAKVVSQDVLKVEICV